MADQPFQRERRKHPRTVLPQAAQPVLQVGPQAFAIVDISASGLRFHQDDSVKLNGWINGRIIFADREPIKIDGIVVRHRDGDMGLHFATPMALPANI